MGAVSAKVRAGVLAGAFLICWTGSAWAQGAASVDAGHFYDAGRFDDPGHFDDPATPLDVKEISVRQRGGVAIHEVTYVGGDGSAVSAYLLVPAGRGPFAAILWGHWLMPGSPLANREEFLDEAVALAPAGVVSLLIDAPHARAGFKPEPGPALIARQVVDLRRGVDLLAARRDVDAKRIAYVGHSWDAGTGAILDAVDKRLAAFVFMGGPQSNREYVLKSDSPRMVAARRGVDLAKVEQAMQANAWADPSSYAARLGPAPALFQYGLQDAEWVPLQDAKDFVALAAGPKDVRYYVCGHALNAAARVDRVRFLRERLGFGGLAAGVIESVPAVR